MDLAKHTATRRARARSSRREPPARERESHDGEGAAREYTLVTPDGAWIAATLFPPADGAPAPRGGVLVAGGTGIPQRFYAPFARALSRAGYTVMTLDYRGMGRSRDGHPRPTMRGWARDLDAALGELRGLLPAGAPLVYVGHSFGGQALGLLPRAPREVAAVVLVAAQSGWLGHWPLPMRAQLAALWYAGVPLAARAFGRMPGWMGVGADLPAGVAREWARWCRDREYLRGVVPRAEQHHEALRVPLLAYSFADDALAPPRAVAALLGWYAGARIERRAAGAEGLGHFGFFRAAQRARWDEITAWLAAQLG